MGESRTVSAISAPDAEEFFTSGTQVWPPTKTKIKSIAEGRSLEDPASILPGDLDDFPEPHMEPCCQRVDVPAIGLTHAFDCPAHPPTFINRDAPKGPTLAPNALQRMLREEILGHLIFAARNLAQANIVRGNPGGILSMGLALFCKECHFGATSDGVLHHATSCDTGHTLRLIDELIAEPAFHNPQPKEAAPAEETGRVDAGTRPRGLNQRVCLRCGHRDGEFAWMSYRVYGEIDLSMLALNQCVCTTLAGKKTLYTHLCPDSVPADVTVLDLDGTTFLAEDGAE